VANSDVVDNRVTTIGNNDLQREERKSEESVDNGLAGLTFNAAFSALAKEENRKLKIDFERKKAIRQAEEEENKARHVPAFESGDNLDNLPG
jgi:predicted RNA-binding protein